MEPKPRKPVLPSPDLEEAVRTMKLRSTATGVNAHPNKADLLKMMVHAPMSRSSIASDILAIEDAATDSQSLASGSSNAKRSSSPLPLPPAQEPVPTAQPLPPDARQPRKSVPEVLNDLKMAVLVSKSKGKNHLSGEQGLEKDEEAKQAEAVKREAMDAAKDARASKRQKQEKAVNPKACVGTMASQKTERREKKMLAKITSEPKQVQKKGKTNEPVKMDRKNVASRAYHAMLKKMEKEMCHEMAELTLKPWKIGTRKTRNDTFL